MTSRAGPRASRRRGMSPAGGELLRDCLGLILVALALGRASPARAGEPFSATDSLIAKVADVAFDTSGEMVLVASDLGAVSAWDPAAGVRLWHRPAPTVPEPTVVALVPFLAAVVLGDREGALLERPDEQELTLEVVADQAEGEPSRPVVVRLPVGR